MYNYYTSMGETENSETRWRRQWFCSLNASSPVCPVQASRLPALRLAPLGITRRDET